MNLFEGAYEAWEICGTVRRGRPGHSVVHLARPARDRVGNRENVNMVWNRAVELLVGGAIGMWQEPGLPPRWLTGGDSDESTLLIDARLDDHKHTIALATLDNWGMRLVQHTGPPLFWQMCVRRLEHTGVFKIHDGHVCWIDRSITPHKLSRLEVRDETEFFNLARTVYTPPGRRWESDKNKWLHPKLMQREYIPAWCTPYVDPASTPHLFPGLNSKPAYRGRKPRPRGTF
jgi:hypothetical protein